MFRNGSIHVTWFQTVDDSEQWTRYRHQKSGGYDESWNESFSTETILSNPINEGDLAIVSGFFSIPGLLFIIKNGEFVLAQPEHFIGVADEERSHNTS